MPESPIQHPASRQPVRPSAPVWSPKSITIVSVVTVALVAALVLLLGHKSLFARTELTLCIIAGCLFIFLAVGLYRGVRLKQEDIDSAELWPDMSFNNTGHVDLSGLDFSVGDVCGEALLTLGLSLVLVLLAPFILTLLWGVVVLLMVGVFWVLNRALRQVFRHRDECQGKPVASLGYAFFYTILYTGWLMVSVCGIHRIHGHRVLERSSPSQSPQMPIEKG